MPEGRAVSVGPGEPRGPNVHKCAQTLEMDPLLKDFTFRCQAWAGGKVEIQKKASFPYLGKSGLTSVKPYMKTPVWIVGVSLEIEGRSEL